MDQESFTGSSNSRTRGQMMKTSTKEWCNADPCTENRPNSNNNEATIASRLAWGEGVRVQPRSGPVDTETCYSSKETTESCSEEGDNNHRSESSSSNKDGAHPVTSNTTSTNTSGSDDKGGSHASSEEGGEYNNTNNSGNTNVDANSSIAATATSMQQHHLNAANRYHHHHSYHHHHRRQGHNTRQCSEGIGHEPLAVPVTDGLPAAVVAHPDSASSGGECEMQAASGAVATSSSVNLLDPHKEPGFHKIKSTFKRLKRVNDSEAFEKDKKKSSTSSTKLSSLKKPKRTSSSNKHPLNMETDIHHETLKKQSKKELLKEEKHRAASGDSSSEENGAGTNGSSSGSGTEGGYAGSASSNDNTPHTRTESSSSSSEDTPQPRRNHHHHKTNPSNNSNNEAYTTRPLLTRKDESSLSSDIADFSSGATESKVAETMKALQDSASSSESITSNTSSSDAEPKQPRHVRKRRAAGHLPRSFALTAETRNRHGPRSHYSESAATNAPRPPIMTVGSDVMAHILTFLEPPEILSVLTMSLSKEWISTFTRQSELWRVLCLLEPFKAQVEEDDSSSDSSSMESFMDVPSELKLRFGKFRMLYTSFVRCMKYLARIKDDALNGRPPSIIDYGAGEVVTSTATHGISSNQNLQSFLAQARGVVLQQNPGDNDEYEPLSEDENQQDVAPPLAAAALAEPIGVSDDGNSSQEAPPMTRARKSNKKRRCETKQDCCSRDDPNTDVKQQTRKKRKVKYGQSMITQRLLLPATGGIAARSELPWSCAIYSIVNWMVGFADAEGIQTMCLKVLPFLLEDEQQRLTAQRAGLTDVVLRDMVMFPHSPQLHTAAFHTIVLLARPLGGQEGMLFHTSMVNSSGIFNATNGTAANGKNGIAVMLDSMRRFQTDEVLQAMSCWSLVNIALSPAQKDVLIKLGGIEVTTNAMIAHPHSAEVQFRALFALINLVIPCVNSGAVAAPHGGVAAAAGMEESTEREVLDDMVEQIVELVVHAMQIFCSSESILNRACLVLHNLSLTQDYHGALLWTPNCYQMLEWCLSNYRTDQVLQQSSAGTLHRLQMTLSSNEGLRARFNSALASQQQLSLEQAHREAIRLHEQHELQQERNRASGTDVDAL